MSTFICPGQCLSFKASRAGAGTPSSGVECQSSAPTTFWQVPVHPSRWKYEAALMRRLKQQGHLYGWGLNLAQILGNGVNKIKSSWNLMCMSRTHGRNVISLNKWTQAAGRAVNDLPINGWVCGRVLSYCPLLLHPDSASSSAVRNERHRCCPWGMAGQEGLCAALALRKAEDHSCCRKTGPWMPETAGTAVSGASQKLTIMHVMSLQNHICEACRMFLSLDVNYWVIMFMWDRLNSPPKELLWITIATRLTDVALQERFSYMLL